MAEKQKEWLDEEAGEIKEEVRDGTSDLQWLDSERMHGKKNILAWKKITNRAFHVRDWQGLWHKYMFINWIPQGGEQWSDEEIQKLREEVRRTEWIDSEHVFWQTISRRSFPARNWKEVLRKYMTLDPPLSSKHGNNYVGVAAQMSLSSKNPLFTKCVRKK